MHTLIIGCGYLGGHVAARCLRQGQSVAVTTRRPDAAEPFRRQGLTLVVCDVLDPASLRALPAADTVVHAIALDRSSGASMRDVYVTGLANVLEHLPPPRRFVYVSSSSVYGQTDGEWVDEDAATDPQEPAGQVVREAEQLLRQRLPTAVILRFAGIYGPGRLLRRKTIEAGEPIVGDADKWLNLIHVADGAGAVLAAAERGEPGRHYNVCDDEPVRRRDFYQEMARLLGAPEPRFVPPAPDAPVPPHERGNRRLRNRRMREALGVELTFRDYRAGLADATRPGDFSPPFSAHRPVK